MPAPPVLQRAARYARRRGARQNKRQLLDEYAHSNARESGAGAQEEICSPAPRRRRAFAHSVSPPTGPMHLAAFFFRPVLQADLAGLVLLGNAATGTCAELRTCRRIDISPRGCPRCSPIERLLLGRAHGHAGCAIPAIDCGLLFAVINLLPERPRIPRSLHVAGTLGHIEVLIRKSGHSRELAGWEVRLDRVESLFERFLMRNLARHQEAERVLNAGIVGHIDEPLI